MYSTICPRSSDPFCIVTYYIKWVTTSWTDGSKFVSWWKGCIFNWCMCYCVFKLSCPSCPSAFWTYNMKYVSKYTFVTLHLSLCLHLQFNSEYQDELSWKNPTKTHNIKMRIFGFSVEKIFNESIETVKEKLGVSHGKF